MVAIRVLQEISALLPLDSWRVHLSQAIEAEIERLGWSTGTLLVELASS